MANTWCSVDQYHIPTFGLCRLFGGGNESTASGYGTASFDLNGVNGWLKHFLMLRIDLGAWSKAGAFGFIGRITGWTATEVCTLTLGKRNCEWAQQVVLVLATLVLLAWSNCR